MSDARASRIDQLIVIGASAGGVEALASLVATLPVDLAAPVVIAQHLDPTRPSHLADILNRQSSLPVRSVEPRENLTPGTIYVVPSNRHVTITDHHVDVHPDGAQRPTPSVDLLLSTAAETFGERLIAIILTGSGSDGAAGAHVVKEAGGTVIIQDPETAAFPSMPRSLAPSLVDFVLPIDEIGAALVELLAAPLSDPGTAAPDLQPLLARLHERHGIDFSAYKPATITRRLWRRMAAAKTPTVADYLGYLEMHPEEEQRLIADFLIKVTRFFRDPALFARLREEIIPELVAAARASGRELRLWSAGCATGEEAYSLALLVADAIAGLVNPPSVRIFATDLDETALEFARRGIYPASALTEVPAEIVARAFTERDGAFEVTKAIRSLIVFGTHDLAVRPPFPHTDLVLCRNVLIYFTGALQRRALDLFAYSLREGGVLVLGKSETTGSASSAFAPVDRRLRIYRRQGPRPALPPAGLPTTQEAVPLSRIPFPRSRAATERALLQAEDAAAAAQFQGARVEELVRRLPVGVAIINRDYDLEVINGTARELLGIHGLALGQDLIHLAQRIPSTALRAAIDAVFAGEPVQELSTVITTQMATGETIHLRVSCHPDRTTDVGQAETVLVLVINVTAEIEAAQASAQALARATGEVATLQHEVAALQATVERQASASRQVLAANRELTDTVDRLREQGFELRQAAAAAQVAAEEIETLNEELQSSNEELETLHEEAQATVEELNVANDELQARSTELELKSLEQAQMAETLRTLSRRLLLVQEEERQRLALELHDEIGQVLTGLAFQLAVAQEQNGATTLAEASATVQQLTEQVRRLALDLRPQVLDQFGLLTAVQWHLERVQATTGITIHLREQNMAHRRYAPEVEIAVFRIVQEALTNIARYAGVAEAWVTLFSDGSLLLVIQDQGQGFDPDQHRNSSGVGGMRERVELLGGTFTLETAPGEGVHITAEFPVESTMTTSVPGEDAS